MSLARTLWQANSDLAEAALAHPFVRGIAVGTLEREDFVAYVAQDAFFLDAFARAYALGLAHSPDRQSLRDFADLLAGVREELHLHAEYSERWGIDLAAVKPAEVTQSYVDFLLSRAALADIGLTCAAMTPCLRLYAFLGQALAGSERGPYSDWVTTYADDSFENLAATLEGLLDRHAADTASTRTTYRRALQFELAFFSSAGGATAAP
jgi:thiaminase/transcriptional activator TenA